MKHILLCGGFGTRLKKEYFLNKPLNLIKGLPMLQYILESIPSEEIIIIAGNHLKKYQLDTVVHHMTSKKIDLIYIDRATRGPLETAYLGLKKLTNVNADETIIFYDNDTIYKDIEFPKEGCNAIGYLELVDKNKEYQYCFLDIIDNDIKGIYEKKQVSSYYASGIYMFKTKDFFLQNSFLLIKDAKNDELFMSCIYKDLLKKQFKINKFKVGEGICLGTPEDINRNVSKIPFKRLRLCFDLDNTLFKYRYPNEKYSEIKPINEVLNLLKALKSFGHTIIIYTARGMATAKQNQGSALKRVGKDTFDILDKYDVPYDEIYFGKPNADVYIDDKAINTFHDLNKSIGFPLIRNEKFNPTNKFNSIVLEDESIYKSGPKVSMRGEIYFYNQVKNREISKFYPEFLGLNNEGDKSIIQLSRISGFELFKLVKDKFLSFDHLDILFNAFREIHSEKTEINIDVSQIYENYIGKLKKRILNDDDYPFPNKFELIEKIEPIIKDYLFSENFSICGFVHGDPWFSNTMLDLKSNIKFLDMKGDIVGTLTTNGDSLTDHCKILQSLYGFDYIVNDLPIDQIYLNDLREYYFTKLIKLGYEMKVIYAITACLIAKTISFFETNSKYKNDIWSISTKLISLI